MFGSTAQHYSYNSNSTVISGKVSVASGRLFLPDKWRNCLTLELHTCKLEEQLEKIIEVDILQAKYYFLM